MGSIRLITQCCLALGILFAQDSQPISIIDIGNEIQQLEKRYEKLPQVFNDNILSVYEQKLDKRLYIASPVSENRIKVENPSYHWCMSKLYLLSGNEGKLREHYIRYLELFNEDSNIPKLFQQPIPLTDLVSRNKNKNSSIAKNVVQTSNSKLDGKSEPIILKDAIVDMNEIGEKIIPPIEKEKLVDASIEVDKTMSVEDRRGFASMIQSSLEQDTNKRLNNGNEDKENLDSLGKINSTNNIEDSAHPNKLTILSDFEKIGIFSISDLLDYIGGVYVIHRGAKGAQSTLRFNGGGSSHIVFLVNGMRLSHSNIIFDNFDFPFDINDVDFVEVNLSPSSHRYGFSATGMVLNFILKDYDRFNMTVDFKTGDYADNKIYADINLPIGGSNHTLSYSGTGNDGYIYNSNIKKSKFLYRYSLEDYNAVTKVMFGQYTDVHGTLSPLTNSVVHEERYNSIFFDARSAWKFDNTDLKSRTYWTENEFSYLNDNLINPFTVTDFGYEIEGEKSSAKNLYNFGFSTSRQRVSNLSKTEPKRDQLSLFYNSTTDNSNISYSKGISASYFESFGWNYSYGLSFDYQLHKGVNLNYQYDNGYKLPTLFEQYANFGIWNGTINLELEKVATTQVGVTILNDILNLDIALFYKSIDNAIDWKYSSLNSYWTSLNISEVNVNGHKISGDLNIESVPLIGFISELKFDYTFLDLSKLSDEYRYTSNYLTHQLITTFDYDLFFSLSQSWLVRYEDPFRFPSRWLVDTVINLPIWRFNTSFLIENILDVSYQDELGFDASGRWMKFGLQFQY